VLVLATVLFNVFFATASNLIQPQENASFTILRDEANTKRLFFLSQTISTFSTIALGFGAEPFVLLILDMEESDFVQKYGPVRIKFIDPPPSMGLFTRPHALNYFHQGHLYRTKGERQSGRFELFLDLLYVGIVANLAKSTTEDATGLSLLKYLLLFMPAWQIWSDLRDFMNYYYNNDLSQKFFVLWILCLLVVYANNASHVLDSTGMTGLVVGAYVLARCSIIGLIFLYTFFIPEHRAQMRVYFFMVLAICALWLAVIWISVRAKIAVAAICIFWKTWHLW
jgi:hypothetical protein